MANIKWIFFVLPLLPGSSMHARTKNCGPGTDSTDVFVAKLPYNNMVLACQTDINLNLPETHTDYLYRAANSVRVYDNYKIGQDENTNIRMQAGFTIQLKPGTAIHKGNHYLARIVPCDNTCPSAADCIIPKGISPNGDLYNQSFDLTGYCVTSLTVFNRYGLEVYYKRQYTNEWHGQSDKGDLPNGTYFYYITLETNESLTGWVYLMR